MFNIILRVVESIANLKGVADRRIGAISPDDQTVIPPAAQEEDRGLRALEQRVQAHVRLDARHDAALRDELQRLALGDGMQTLRQDGIEKVLAGVTTIEEVRSMSNA